MRERIAPKTVLCVKRQHREMAASSVLRVPTSLSNMLGVHMSCMVTIPCVLDTALCTEHKITSKSGVGLRQCRAQVRGASICRCKDKPGV